jgi:micrococcal nuclease
VRTRTAVAAFAATLLLAACGPGPNPTTSTAATATPTWVQAAQATVDPMVDVTTGVISVTDGDTLRVLYDGASTPVRILGLSAPEIEHGETHGECYGIESTGHLHDLLDGMQVWLVIDPAQGDGPNWTDHFGRLLRYVELRTSEGTTDVGEDQIRKGFGTVYDEYPVNRTPFYQLAEDQAKADLAGLWGACPS